MLHAIILYFAYRQVSGKIKKDLAWLEGESLSDYLHDMAIMQKYASLNRKAIALDILKSMGIVANRHGVFRGNTQLHRYRQKDYQKRSRIRRKR